MIELIFHFPLKTPETSELRLLLTCLFLSLHAIDILSFRSYPF